MGGPWTQTAHNLVIYERDRSETHRRQRELLLSTNGKSKGRSQKAGRPLKSPKPQLELCEGRRGHEDALFPDWRPGCGGEPHSSSRRRRHSGTPVPATGKKPGWPCMTIGTDCPGLVPKSSLEWGGLKSRQTGGLSELVGKRFRSHLWLSQSHLGANATRVSTRVPRKAEWWQK